MLSEVNLSHNFVQDENVLQSKMGQLNECIYLTTS